MDLTPVYKRSNELAVRGKTNISGGLQLTPPNLEILQPAKVKVELDICIDLTIKVAGVKLINVNAVTQLQAKIARQGVALQTLLVAQSSLKSRLREKATSCSSSLDCERACKSDVCKSWTFQNSKRACRLEPVILGSTSAVISNIIADLAVQGSGSSNYCQLCPSKCSSSPSPSARLIKRNRDVVGLCPKNLDACPIQRHSRTLMPKGYECIDTQQELTSCGGCFTTNEGRDCTKVSGVREAGCQAGKCVAYKCNRGHKLLANICVKI